jgi:hypothetical protein
MKLASSLLILLTAAHACARPLPQKTNACQILTRADLAAVQGEAYADARLTERGDTSQCFYELPSFVKSVSIDVTRGGGRKFFRENFPAEKEDREARERAEKRRGGDEAEEKAEAIKRPPKRVRGVGSDAYWVGSRIAGSLFVLKGDSYLRVSPGGPGTEDEKIARAKELARRALRRM